MRTLSTYQATQTRRFVAAGVTVSWEPYSEREHRYIAQNI
jgi:hypothetical protein